MRFLLGLILLFILLLGLGNAMYYQFYAENGWNALWNAQNIIGFLAFSLFFIIFFLPLLAINYTKLINSKLLNFFYNYLLVANATIAVIGLWINRNTLPILMIVFHAILGLVFVYFGYHIIKYGSSLFPHMTNWLSSDLLTDDSSFWMNWLNLRLPDIDQQKALKLALEKKYPPSKLQTLGGVIIFGAGSWLLLTILASLIDWVIQNWLNSLFP